jgi:hypothetical protein
MRNLINRLFSRRTIRNAAMDATVLVAVTSGAIA